MSPQNGKHDAFEIATLVTAIAGVIILCFYTGLTGYQALIAKDTAERQLRAYISVKIEEQPDFSRSRYPEACHGSRQWKQLSGTAHLSEYQERLEKGRRRKGALDFFN